MDDRNVKIAFALAALLAIGCSDRNYNVADPVVGPAPPRIPGAALRAQSEEPAGGIQTVSHDEGPIPMTAVVARVNGRPVLAGEVLETYAGRLEQMRSKVSAEQYRQAQEMILKRDLPNYVEQKLMVEAVKAKLKKEQLEAVEKQLDEYFGMEVDRMKKQFKVGTASEVEAVLQEQGMSLETMRKMFGEQKLAAEYVGAKMGEDAPVTRQELLEQYTSRLEEYALPAQIKWQQLQISKSGRDGESTAVQRMDEALAELRSGADFGEVVKKYSTGPLAENGGHWDWTQPASIANAEIRKALEELPEGEMSGLIASGNMLQVVKVNGRRPARHKPFSEVQESIRKEMLEKRREQAAERIVDELKATAVIETIFDGQTAARR